MNNSKSNSPLRERKRTPMACMNCRTRKLKCRSSEPTEYAPCERCLKEGLPCEYRPVDQGQTSNSQGHSIQDSVNLYPVPSAHPANHWSQPNVQPSTSGGYRPDYPYNPPTQTPMHPNQSFYPTPQYGEQMMPHSSYQAPQNTYNTWPSAYPAGQPNYRAPPQFNNHNPNQPMPYHASALAPAHYDQSRTYHLDSYGNWQMDNSKPARE